MKTRDVMLDQRAGPGAGTQIPAQLILCPRCDGDQFHIYSVEGHSHLQCVQCTTSYCCAGSDCGADGRAT